MISNKKRQIPNSKNFFSSLSCRPEIISPHWPLYWVTHHNRRWLWWWRWGMFVHPGSANKLFIISNWCRPISFAPQSGAHIGSTCRQRFPSHPINPSHPLVAQENFCPYIWEMEKHLSIVTLHNQCNKTHLFRIYLGKDKDKDWKWKRPSITIFSKSRHFEDIKYETERSFATKSESQQHQRICGISSQKVRKSYKWG